MTFNEMKPQTSFAECVVPPTIEGLFAFEGGFTICPNSLKTWWPGTMGLLRVSADAIIVGARTVHEVSPKSLWIPEYTYPDAKQLYAEYRVNVLHKPKYPVLVIVSGSGRLELERAIFRTPGVRTVVITTSAGRDELTRRGATTLGSVEIHALNSNSGSIAPLSILRLLNLQFGIRMLLHEGGATLFGQFLAAEAVDELFMTLSPQIAVAMWIQFDPHSCKGWRLCRIVRLGFNCSTSSKRLSICTCATGVSESTLDVVTQNFEIDPGARQRSGQSPEVFVPASDFSSN